LGCGSLHGDFDVLYGHLLVLEDAPDVLPDAGRELGEILRNVVATFLGG
jgi:hypothetical protein